MKVGIFKLENDESGSPYNIYAPDMYRQQNMVVVGMPDTLEEKVLFNTEINNLRWGVMEAKDSVLVKRILDEAKTIYTTPEKTLAIQNTAEGYKCRDGKPDIWLTTPDFRMPGIGEHTCNQDGLLMTRIA